MLRILSKNIRNWKQCIRSYATNPDANLSSEQIQELNKQARKGVGVPILEKQQLKDEAEEAIHDVDMRHNYNRYHVEEAIDKSTSLRSSENKELKKEIKREVK